MVGIMRPTTKPRRPPPVNSKGNNAPPRNTFNEESRNTGADELPAGWLSASNYPARLMPKDRKCLAISEKLFPPHAWQSVACHVLDSGQTRSWFSSHPAGFTCAGRRYFVPRTLPPPPLPNRWPPPRTCPPSCRRFSEWLCKLWEGLPMHRERLPRSWERLPRLLEWLGTGCRPLKKCL